ncbi:MAG TPA: PAS domain S-box protein, partial [Bryobacteraceae bacterium]|nr:PAS domain S-box protein [Bryobacteraceae bacterium]
FLVSAFSSEPGCFTAIFSVITEGKRVEQDLARSNEEFLAVVNNSPDGIARLDLHGRFTFVNPRMAELARCRVGDLIGQPEGLPNPRDSQLWFRMVRHVVETQKRLITEYFFPRGLIDDGLKVLVQFVPECDSNGVMRAILMFATDITELQRAQTIASERGSILETLFETAAQGIVAVDTDGTIRLANRRAEQMFGYEAGGLVNQPHEILLPEEIRAKHAADRQAYLAAPERRLVGPRHDLLARRKDGSLFPAEISLSYVNSRYGVLGVSFITDITARNQQEEELRTLRARVIAAQEDASRELAQELHDDITQRLAFLSVEIGKAATLPDQPNVSIRKLKSFQKRIQELSEGVRQISHRLHPSVLDHLGLSAALEELCIFTEEAGSLTIHFHAHDVPDTVETATASCLYRVCQECMSNILKHARAESVNVVLRVEVDSLQLAIDDDGAGFDPELARSGVGTYSMRERVRLLNGTISIESEPGKGTRVRVNVPLSLRLSGEEPA